MRRWIIMSGVIAVTLTLGMAFLPESRAANPFRVGTVDIQQILLESKAGKQAKAKVEAERDLRQKEITAKEEEVAKLQQDLGKQSSILSEAARKEKQDAIDRKVRDLKRIYDDFSRDLQKKEGELVRELLKELTALIRDYGKEKGYTLILERGQSGIVYGTEEIDLTKAIMALFDAKTK